MKLFYSPSYVAAAYAFDTTRKSAEIVKSLEVRPIAGVEIVEPRSLTVNELVRVHDPRYVEAVRTGLPRELASSSGFPWDPGVWEAVTASNGGAVAAALEALNTGAAAGSLSSGLHHAHRESGGGFCTFNGLVLAAFAARDAGAERVLILDFDAHYGDGTADLIDDEDEFFMVDVSSKWPMPGADYLDRCRRALDEIADSEGPYDLVIYNAGMDPHEDCRLGGIRGVDRNDLESRERLVFGHCSERNWPVAFVLAGGYANELLTMDRLVDLHRLTISAALDSPKAKK
ncbi:hypothetical protein GC170_09880 [bacterium]|nr:hypothetical protein [bacterium]